MISLRTILKGILLQNEADRTKSLGVQISSAATTATSTTIVAQQTANRTVTLPDITGTLSTAALPETLTNKSIDGNTNTISGIGIGNLQAVIGDANKAIVRDASGVVVSSPLADVNVATNAAIALSKLAPLTSSKALVSDVSGVIAPSATTSTELGYVSGVTSAIQTQINSKPTTGTLTDKHVVRANGTGSVQDSLVVIDDSGNMTGVQSLVTAGGNITISASTVSGTNNSALFFTTNLASQPVHTNRQVLIESPASGIPGQLSIREDQATGFNQTTFQPTNLTADRVITLPDATTTMVGTDATQTLSNKTFADAVTGTQIATPSTPSAGTNKLYFKSDDRLYAKSSAGTETKVSNSNIAVASVSTLYNSTNNDDLILGNSTSANFVVNLFTAVGNSGKILTIKKTSSDTNFITLVPNASETIDGGTNYRVFTQYEEVQICSNGANWFVLSKTIPPQVQYANSAFSATAPAVSDTWFNVVGNNITLPNGGIWELTASVIYGNNGSNPGYGNKYGYWCAATGSNTSTNPAAVSTVATVLGGYTAAYIDNSSTDATSIVVLPPLIVQPPASGATIFVGTRAVAATIANVRITPTITAKRIG